MEPTRPKNQSSPNISPLKASRIIVTSHEREAQGAYSSHIESRMNGGEWGDNSRSINNVGRIETAATSTGRGRGRHMVRPAWQETGGGLLAINDVNSWRTAPRSITADGTITLSTSVGRGRGRHTALPAWLTDASNVASARGGPQSMLARGGAAQTLHSDAMEMMTSVRSIASGRGRDSTCTTEREERQSTLVSRNVQRQTSSSSSSSSSSSAYTHESAEVVTDRTRQMEIDDITIELRRPTMPSEMGGGMRFNSRAGTNRVDDRDSPNLLATSSGRGRGRLNVLPAWVADDSNGNFARETAQLMMAHSGAAHGSAQAHSSDTMEMMTSAHSIASSWGRDSTHTTWREPRQSTSVTRNIQQPTSSSSSSAAYRHASVEDRLHPRQVNSDVRSREHSPDRTGRMDIDDSTLDLRSGGRNSTSMAWGVTHNPLPASYGPQRSSSSSAYSSSSSSANDGRDADDGRARQGNEVGVLGSTAHSPNRAEARLTSDDGRSPPVKITRAPSGLRGQAVASSRTAGEEITRRASRWTEPTSPILLPKPSTSSMNARRRKLYAARGQDTQTSGDAGGATNQANQEGVAAAAMDVENPQVLPTVFEPLPPTRTIQIENVQAEKVRATTSLVGSVVKIVAYRHVLYLGDNTSKLGKLVMTLNRKPNGYQEKLLQKFSV